MWETAVKKHEESLIQKGMIVDKQQILIEQMTIKFGQSDSTEKKIRTTRHPTKLDAALRTFVSAKSREEVLKCID